MCLTMDSDHGMYHCVLSGHVVMNGQCSCYIMIIIYLRCTPELVKCMLECLVPTIALHLLWNLLV